MKRPLPPAVPIYDPVDLFHEIRGFRKGGDDEDLPAPALDCTSSEKDIRL